MRVVFVARPHRVPAARRCSIAKAIPGRRSTGTTYAHAGTRAGRVLHERRTERARSTSRSGPSTGRSSSSASTATMLAGACTAPLYQTLSASERPPTFSLIPTRRLRSWRTRITLAKVLEIRDQLPSLRCVVLMDGVAPEGDEAFVVSWTDALQRGLDASRQLAEDLDRAQRRGATERHRDPRVHEWHDGSTEGGHGNTWKPDRGDQRAGTHRQPVLR